MSFLPDSATQLTVRYGTEEYITISRSILLLGLTITSSILCALTIAPRSVVFHQPLLLTSKWSYILILEIILSAIYTFAAIASVVELSILSTNTDIDTRNNSFYSYTIFHSIITGILWLSILIKGGIISQRTALSLVSSIIGSIFSIGLIHSSIIRLLPNHPLCIDSTLAICDCIMGWSYLLLCCLHTFGISGIKQPTNNLEIEEEQQLLSSSSTSTPTISVTTTVPPISQHDKSNLYSKIIFSFLDMMFTVGYTRQLNMEDVEALPAHDATEKWAKIFQEELSQWRQRQEQSSLSSPNNHVYNTTLPILFTLLLRVFGISWAYLAFLQAGCITMAMISPILLNQLLGFIEASSSSTISIPWYGLLWAMLLSCTQIGAALFTTQFCYWFTRLQLQVRAALVAAIYTSAIKAPLSVRSGTTTGKITNYLSVDIQKIQDVVPSFHQFWSLPIQVGITLYLLYTQVAGAFTAGLVVLAIFIPLNMVVSKRIGTLTGVMMKCRDERVRITGELLSGIRVIKMQAWEIPLTDRIRVARNLELQALRSRKYLDAVCVFLWASTPVLIALATFTAVVLLPSSSANSLSASTVFTTISLLNLLIFPMNAFPWVLTGVFEAWVSLKRLQGFLCYTNNDQNNMNHQYDAPEYEIEQELSKDRETNPPLCRIQGTFQFLASKDSDSTVSDTEHEVNNNPAFSLRLYSSSSTSSIDIHFREFIVITGPVGSGKSAFFSALLRDMIAVQAENNPSDSSFIKLANDCTFSYAPQMAWIRGASLRDNIVFGSIWNKERYQRVITACCLEPDIATLSDGDNTIISDTTLSGGQKQRINLARALYAYSKVILLDDPLSALDARVANQMWSRALSPFRPTSTNSEASWSLYDQNQCSFLAADQRTVILVTHDRKLMEADKVLVLKKGNIVYWGQPQFMTAEAKEVSDMNNTSHINNIMLATPESDLLSNNNILVSSTETKSLESTKDQATIEDEREREEAREKGLVKQQVIRTYIDAIGKGLSIIVLVSLTMMQLSRNGSDWWLSVWSAAVTDPEDATGASAPLIRLLAIWNNHQFLLVYGIIASVNILSTIVRSWSFAEAGIRAAINLHDRLLMAIVYAPMVFHDKTPAGRLLNRFSADQYAVDESLPFQLNIFLAQLYGMIGTIIVLTYSTSGIFLIALPPLAYIYYHLQKRYRATSRELKRLDSVTRSPLFSQFGDSLDGNAIIRAQSINRKLQNVPLLLRESIDPEYRYTFHSIQYSNVYGSFQYEYQQTLQYLDANQRTSFTSGMASQWLALRLQGIGTLIIAVVAFVAAFTRIFTDTARSAQGDDAGCISDGSISILAHILSLEDNNDDGGDAGAAGIAGLSLSYAIPIVGALQSLISAFAETEKEMVSVERIREYVDVLPEESIVSSSSNNHDDDDNVLEISDNTVGNPKQLSRNNRKKNQLSQPLLSNNNDEETKVIVSNNTSSSSLWIPRQGLIEFENLTIQYPATIRPAIDSLTIKILPGTKVGICGRTGSGKTSIISALWRLVRWQQGSIKIDSQDLRSIPLVYLRSNISIVPQEPLLFSGTIKYNLDPAGIYSDEELLVALNACQLLPESNLSNNNNISSSYLSTPSNISYLQRYIEENGQNWSVGERQLLCLARALLRKTKVIAVDEATSAADARTEELISNILHTTFSNSTILIIAHRITTLLQCDIIMVMDNGKCTEVGKPQLLLNQQNSIFSQLLKASGGTSTE